MAGLEDGVPLADDPYGARASVIVRAGEFERLQATLWMGGARSILGEALDQSGLGKSMVIDCAGEMPAAYRAAAAAWIPCVFVDHDGPIPAMHRLQDVARRAAVSATGEGINSIYVMCTHGMNRSGLLSGMILRELGIPGGEAIERIRAARPGALSNMWFRDLLSRG